MKLLLSQKDELFLSIERAGLSPFQFDFQEVPSQIAFGQIGTRLNLKGTEYYFIFETSNDSLGNHFAMFCPGASVHTGREYTGTWEKQKDRFYGWLLWLLREINSPNRWERLNKEIAELDIKYEDESSKFSVHEFEEVQANIITLKQNIISIGLTSEQFNTINNKLDNLTQLAKEMNKFDWKSLFIGTIVSIVIQLGVTPENAKTLWQMIKQSFHSYFLI